MAGGAKVDRPVADGGRREDPLGEPVLGDDVERFLNGVTLDRVDELLGGSTPTSRVERDLLMRLDDGLPVLP